MAPRPFEESRCCAKRSVRGTWRAGPAGELPWSRAERARTGPARSWKGSRSAHEEVVDRVVRSEDIDPKARARVADRRDRPERLAPGDHRLGDRDRFLDVDPRRLAEREVA